MQKQHRRFNRPAGHLMFLVLLIPNIAMSSNCTNYEWSTNPGAYEMQLMRRCHSPYFPLALRKITLEELSEAKNRDNSDYVLVQKNYADLDAAFRAVNLNPTFDELNSLREQSNDLIEYSLGVSGAANEFAEYAMQLREKIVARIKELYSDNIDSLKIIERAERFHNEVVSKFNFPFFAQAHRKPGPIDPEYYLYSVLTEPPETIRFILTLMPSDLRAQVRVELLRITDEAVKRGEIEANLIEKIYAISE